MAKLTGKKMCTACPFQKASPKGWLGPWTAEGIQASVRSDNDLVCHLDIDKRLKKGQSLQVIGEDGVHCVGAVRHMTACMQRSRDPDKSAYQTKLEGIPRPP